MSEKLVPSPPRTSRRPRCLVALVVVTMVAVTVTVAALGTAALAASPPGFSSELQRASLLRPSDLPEGWKPAGPTTTGPKAKAKAATSARQVAKIPGCAGYARQLTSDLSAQLAISRPMTSPNSESFYNFVRWYPTLKAARAASKTFASPTTATCFEQQVTTGVRAQVTSETLITTESHALEMGTKVAGASGYVVTAQAPVNGQPQRATVAVIFVRSGRYTSLYLANTASELDPAPLVDAVRTSTARLRRPS